MPKNKALTIVFTVLTLLLCALLVTAVLSLYLGGAARRAASGSEREPIFTPESIGRWLPWVLSLLGIGAAVTGNLAPKRTPARLPKGRAEQMGEENESWKKWVRVLLAAAALALIILGICNGGLYDVFVKAVHICTECIGLG